VSNRDTYTHSPFVCGAVYLLQATAPLFFLKVKLEPKSVIHSLQTEAVQNL
jgi:hypothetical protein